MRAFRLIAPHMTELRETESGPPVPEPAVHAEKSEIPSGLEGLSSIEARRRLAQVGPNRWVKRNRLARVRDIIGLLLDPMAVMLVVAAAVYFLLGETRDAIVLALALIPVLGVDVVLETRSRAARRPVLRGIPRPHRPRIRPRHHDRGSDAVRRHRRPRGADGVLSQSAATTGGGTGPVPWYRCCDCRRRSLHSEPRTW